MINGMLDNHRYRFNPLTNRYEWRWLSEAYDHDDYGQLPPVRQELPGQG
jgi:hypothetical protein